MIEVELEDLEEFLREEINDQYSKIKKACRKLISDIRTSLIDIKVCMDHFIDSGTDKVNDKALRSLNFFSDKIKKEIDEVEIPEEEEIYYDNVIELISSIKKLFTTMNDIQRKSLPKFAKEVQAEIKELAYLQRKLAKKHQVLDIFLRKKYTNPKSNVKSAEDLIKRIPKLFTLKENIGNAKEDLDNLEKEEEELKEELEKQNQELLEIEKDKVFKELKSEKESLFKLQLKIKDQLGFKKALKKLKFELERETIPISNINMNFLRDFLKNPIRILIKERKDLPNLRTLLVQLRHSLEENKLNLKADTRDKTIEQINEIFEEKDLQTDIEKYNEIKQNIRAINNKIKEIGIAEKRDEVKQKISADTAKLEHLENDLNRRNKDYLRHLGNLKKEREEFQNLINEILGIDAKIKITFNF